MISTRFIFLMLSLLPIGVHAQINYSDYNISFKYQSNSTVQLNDRLLDRDSVFLLAAEIQLVGAPTLFQYDVLYHFMESYTSNVSLKGDTVNLEESIKRKKGIQYYLEIILPKIEAAEYILLEFKDHNSRVVYAFDIPIHKVPGASRSDIQLSRAGDTTIYIPTYLKENDTLHYTGYKDQNLYIYHYEADFSIAAAPMNTSGGNANKSLTISYVEPWNRGKGLQIEKNELIFIQSDTTSISGLTYLGTDKVFPKFSAFEALIEPLTFISTSTEMNRLLLATDKKKAFDRFWMDLTRSADNARKIIRSYYDRIEEANLMFTGFKEGWKSDKGMIYVIFGPPEEAIFDGSMETWRYENLNNMTVIFRFRKVPNIFVDDYFILIRDAQYEDIWLSTVKAWRDGNL